MDHAPSPSGYLYRLALIVDGVYRAVAAHIARDRTAGPTIVLVCNDVRRRFFRFAELVERVQQGILPRTRLRRPPATPRLAAERARKTQLPRGKGFLVKMMQAAPWTVTVYASQLNHWLTDPAVAAFLADYPQARRTLRALWRLVSLDPLPEAMCEPPREEPGPDAATAAPDAVEGSDCAAPPAFRVDTAAAGGCGHGETAISEYIAKTKQTTL